MNIKSEPLSDKEGAEAEAFFPTLRRSTRVKKSTLDFSLIKPRRKKKAHAVNEDRITPTLSPNVNIKLEKSPLDLPLEREDDGGSPFLITLETPCGAGLEDLEEMARSSESTLTAHSDVGSVASVESFGTVSEEDPILQEHSYCSNPRRVVRTHIKKEKKSMEAAPVAPKPTVDLSTLAIYRALMDHNYSTITPSALIEAVMLKHDYVCTFQALQDFSADMEPYEAVTNFMSRQQIKTEPATDLQAAQPKDWTTDAIGAESKKVSPGRPEKGVKRKSTKEKLVRNPKYKPPTKKPNQSEAVPPPPKSPKLVSSDSKSPTRQPSSKKTFETESAAPREPSKKKKMKSSEAAKSAADLRLKKEKEIERISLASKIKVQLRLKKRKRRKNATGWPNKRPQPTGKKPKKLSNSKKDVSKVKNGKYSRDSSSTGSIEKEPKDGFIPMLSGIVLSIEEAVKRRRQSNSKLPIEDPQAGSERGRKKGRSASPRKAKTVVAVKGPARGKRKVEDQDNGEFTGEETEIKEATDEFVDASAKDQSSEIESRLSQRSQTNPSKSQMSPSKSPRRARKPINVTTEPVEGDGKIDAAEPSSKPKVGLRKRVKRQIASMFKKKGSPKIDLSQTTDDTKRQAAKGSLQKRKSRKTDGADVNPLSGSKGERANAEAASAPVAKKVSGKLKWGRKKSNDTSKSSQDSSKSKQETKKLRNRKPPLPPPTSRVTRSHLVKGKK